MEERARNRLGFRDAQGEGGVQTLQGSDLQTDADAGGGQTGAPSRLAMAGLAGSGTCSAGPEDGQQGLLEAVGDGDAMTNRPVVPTERC